NIYENKNGVLLLGCWAHARRKFEQALKNDPVRADFALKQIQLLYLLERQAEEEKRSKEQIELLRKEKAYPILKVFEKWLDANYPQVLPKSPIGQAISYTYTIYPRLVRYVADGRYKIDNNGAENGIRPLALGRKNFLFCGNHLAAHRTAIIYSLLGTCKINNVNPEQWLSDVFNNILDCKRDDLRYLLPDEWAKKQTSL
ncbi:MAG: transposase, partial [Dysgonamonadaceae bacterium]|nr:transposase [Dysgonamonadaceae bacterium]